MSGPQTYPSQQPAQPQQPVDEFYLQQMGLALRNLRDSDGPPLR